MDEIVFTKVGLPNGWLGNMSPHPIEFDGRVYLTGEALFQVLRFHDAGIRSAIRTARSPMTAKMIAKANAARMAIIPRSLPDLANMRLVLELKLAQHQDLQTCLLETGDAVLIEDCSARASPSGLFWGMARVWSKELTMESWRGENWLGKLWMERRTALQGG